MRKRDWKKKYTGREMGGIFLVLFWGIIVLQNEKMIIYRVRYRKELE